MKTNYHPVSPAANRAEEVIVRLSSGLGNQLFQFTYGLWLATKWNATLRFDTTWFQLISGIHPVKRQLRLDEFLLEIPEAFRGLKRLAVGFLAALYDRNRRGGRTLCKLGEMCIIQETMGDWVRGATTNDSSNRRVYLNGYWQSGEAFLAVRDRLVPDLVPRHPLSPGAKKYIAQAGSTTTGFVHVRRGDYIHFMGDAALLPPSYYANALASLSSAGKRIGHWLIFSEDRAWAKANLNFMPNAEFVDYPSPRRDIEDLMIMKACSAGIIANSSYSWWGAALGDRPERTIITPDRYWRTANWTTQEWALPHWTSIKGWN